MISNRGKKLSGLLKLLHRLIVLTEKRVDLSSNIQENGQHGSPKSSFSVLIYPAKKRGCVGRALSGLFSERKHVLM
jgi:hypothetical protein